MTDAAHVRYSIGERKAEFVVNRSVYPLDAIYGTAYIFIDRCYVFLEPAEDDAIRVRLRTRAEATEAELEKLAGEFGNELLNQVLRVRLAESTSSIRQAYIARAFAAPAAPASIDAILAELDAEEMAAGDLEIQMPWQGAAGK